jgi:photosystem II stability/assembly factor-like uncharacterized protein
MRIIVVPAAVLLLLLLSLHAARAQWQRVDAPVTSTVNFMMAYDSTGLLVATHGESSGLLISTDRGVSWRAVDSMDAIWSVAADGDTIWAGGERGSAYRSTDRGVTWSPIYVGLDDANELVLTKAGDLLFAGNYPTGSSATNLFRSSDGGLTWGPFSFATPDHLIRPVTALIGVDTTLVASVLEGGLFRSTDLGEQWAPADGVPYAIGTQAFAHASGTTWYAGSTGLYRSLLRIDSLDSLGSVDSLKSYDTVMTWSRIDGIERPYAVAAEGATIVVGMEDSVCVSIDSGATWQVYKGGLPVKGGNFFWGVAIMGDAIYAGAEQLWRMPRPMPVSSAPPVDRRPAPVDIVVGAGDILVRGGSGPVDVRVISLLGDQLAHARGSSAPVRIGGLHPGVYIVQACSGDAVRTAKVMVGNW